MDIIDFKKEEDFIEQYVYLRNSYAEQLLASPVDIYETKKWLKKAEVEIRGLFHRVFLAPDYETARRRARELIARFKARYPSAMEYSP